MNIIIIFPLVISVSICAIQNVFVSSEQITPFVNKRIQNYVNNLFHYLKMQKHFRHYYKIKILLIMYDNLNNAIEFNWKAYSDIKQIVAVASNITDNIIYKLVEEALHKKQCNSTIRKNKIATEVYKLTEETTNEDRFKNVKITKAGNMTVTHTTDIWDSGILDKFLDKINNLTVDDFISKPVNKTYLKINQHNRYKLPNRINMDLKAWDPNEYIEGFMSRRMFNPAKLVEKYPFVASIHVMDKLTCTGSIISKDAVITAASCLPISYNRKMILRMPNLIYVRVGSDFAEKYGERVPAKDVEFHPQFDPKTLMNNLAIIRLKLQKHARTRPKIRKIRLDEGAALRGSIRSVQIFGYGAGTGQFKGEKRIATANLDLVPLPKCAAIFSRKFVSEANFCAGVSSRRTTQCNGDMGAPAVSDGLLVGVVAFGSPSCDRGTPTVFTKIDFHYRWISYVINQKWKNQNLPYPTAITGHKFATRMGVDNFKPKRSPSTKPSYIILRQNIFNEIRAILKYISNPFSILRNLFNGKGKNIRDDKDNDKDNDKDKDKDDPFQFILEATETTPVYNHSLYNKSVIPIPGVHYLTSPKTTRAPSTAFSRPDIGLPDWIPYDYIQNYIENSDELDYYIKRILEGHSSGIKGFPRTRARSVSEVTRGYLWDKNFHYFPKDFDKRKVVLADHKKKPRVEAKRYRVNSFNAYKLVKKTNKPLKANHNFMKSMHG